MESIWSRVWCRVDKSDQWMKKAFNSLVQSQAIVQVTQADFRFFPLFFRLLCAAFVLRFSRFVSLFSLLSREPPPGPDFGRFW